MADSRHLCMPSVIVLSKGACSLSFSTLFTLGTAIFRGLSGTGESPVALQIRKLHFDEIEGGETLVPTLTKMIFRIDFGTDLCRDNMRSNNGLLHPKKASTYA